MQMAVQQVDGRRQNVMAMVADNEKMVNAKTTIESMADDFKTNKANEFITSLTTALSTFEGETKDALMESKIGKLGTETEGTLAYFVETQIPQLIKGLAELLNGNINTIDESDKKLADAIRGNNG